MLAMKRLLEEPYRSRLVIIVSLIASFAAGYYFYPYLRTGAVRTDGLRMPLSEDSKYTFIRPLLACQTYDNLEYSKFSDLKELVSANIAKSESAGLIDSASVYFRDLLSGRWMGVDENREYSPASLLKIPVMIAYLKQAEANPPLLQKRFYYEDTDPQNVKPLISNPILANGNTYTALELMRGMIIDSDNHAKDLLEASIDPATLRDTYDDLGIVSPINSQDTVNNNYQISTKTYALFLRVLYNGTYLTKDDSELAMNLLSQAKFDKGLRAGIPANVPIAHKYGIRLVSVDDGRENVELNDCGIVYNKNSPYLLCVMTSGHDPEKMASFIAHTASIVQAAEGK